jgi:hypothetical protein
MLVRFKEVVMSPRTNSSTIVKAMNVMTGAACAVVLCGSVASGQIRRQPQGAKPDQVPLHIALKAGGTPYTFDGQGKCARAERASIYDTPASMWSIAQNGEGRNLTLTMWRLQSGGDMMSLGVSSGSKSHNVDTVKVGRKAETQGTGTVKFEPAAQGGTFTIDATAADGTKITGTVTCESFTSAIAEGGD